MSSSTSRPSSSKRVAARPTATSPSTTRAPAAASTFRSSACAHTAPNMPVLAPTTATGLLRSTALANGREAQSIAFLSCPGIDELYSGVATRIASAPAMASRRSATPAGGLPSSSSSKGGTAFSPSHRTSSTSGPSSSSAARRSCVLWDPRRRLPEMPRMRIVAPCLGGLHELELGRKGHVVRECGLARRKRVVPGQAELRPVDRRLELHAEALTAEGICDRIADGAAELHRLRMPLQRELAVDRHLVARALDLVRAKRQRRMALGVEELGALQVRLEVRVLHLHARDVSRALERPVAKLGREGRKGSLEGPGHVLHAEPDLGVHGVRGPGSDRNGLACLGGAHRSPPRSAAKVECANKNSRDRCAVKYLRGGAYALARSASPGRPARERRPRHGTASTRAASPSASRPRAGRAQIGRAHV